MREDLAHYVNAFAKLRTDAGKAKYPEVTLYRAPHKPLLLLSVLDLAAQGNLAKNQIELTPDLGELFAGYWRIVMPLDRSANIFLPFFHLKSDGFWHLIPQHGQELMLAASRSIRSAAQFRETVFGAELDDTLYQLICAEETRNVLRAVLVESYFAPVVHNALIEQAGVNILAYRYSQELLQNAITTDGQTRYEASQVDLKPAARDQGFRRAIVTAYDHRCVFCGIRLLTLGGRSAATAAHIIPWSVSHNDEPGNGLCLCRLCHWVFDEGLISISAKYTVLLSTQLAHVGNISGHLSTLDKRPIFEAVEPSFNPHPDALEWHRKYVYLP